MAFISVTQGPETAGQQPSSEGEIVTNGLCFHSHDLHRVMGWLGLINTYRWKGVETATKVANINSHTP